MTRIGSLCTGYGGLDMAVESVLGGELAWVADIDPGASAILAHRYPTVPNLHDLTAQDWANAEPVDILTAGFPCQPVSLAGKRLGEADERWIWPDVARAVRDLRPGLVVLENVAALVARGLAGVAADLAAIGYVGSWRCIRASDVGAPHGRNRVFIAAWPAADTDGSGRRTEQGPAWRRGSGGLRAARHCPGDSERGTPEDANRSVGGERREPIPGQAPGGWPWADASGPSGAPAPADATGDGRHQGRPEPAGIIGRPDAALGRDGATSHPDGDGLARCPERDSQPQERRASHEQRRVDPLRCVLDWGIYGPAVQRWERVLGRPAPRPTEPGRTGERLSPRFVEWMQGLPDGWVTNVPGLSRNQMLKALGNGVVPQQAAAALRLLLEVSGNGRAA